MKTKGGCTTGYFCLPINTLIYEMHYFGETWIVLTSAHFCINVLGEAKFLGGVASAKGIQGFDTEAAKKRFFDIYLDKVNWLQIFILMIYQMQWVYVLMPY